MTSTKVKDAEGTLPEGEEELMDEESLDLDTGSETDSPAADPVIKLEQALAQARIEHAELESKARTAMAEGNLTAMLSIAKDISAAELAVKKANSALDAATYERKAGERMAFSVALKDTVEAFIGAEIDEAAMRTLGLRAITITLVPDGEGFTVDILAKDAPRVTGQSGTRKCAIAGEGNRGRAAKWTVPGQPGEYTSREMIERFGGEAGAKALDRYDHYKDYGLQFSPGFDSFAKKLARELNATRN